MKGEKSELNRSSSVQVNRERTVGLFHTRIGHTKMKNTASASKSLPCSDGNKITQNVDIPLALSGTATGLVLIPRASLQTSPLASWMPAEDMSETPGTETWDFTTHSPASSMSITVTPLSLSLESHRRKEEGPGRCYEQSEFVSQPGNPKLRKLGSLKRTTADLSNPLLHWETLCLSAQDESYTNTLIKVVQIKRTGGVLPIRHAETCGTRGELCLQKH